MFFAYVDGPFCCVWLSRSTTLPLPLNNRMLVRHPCRVVLFGSHRRCFRDASPACWCTTPIAWWRHQARPSFSGTACLIPMCRVYPRLFAMFIGLTVFRSVRHAASSRRPQIMLATYHVACQVFCHACLSCTTRGSFLSRVV